MNFYKTIFLLIIAFIPLCAISQNLSVKVTGTVLDTTSDPLPGVSILLKGTSTGTVSDLDGNFLLNIPGGNQTLVITYVGMKTQEISVNENTSFPLRIILEDDVQLLEEVVMVGYGVQKRAMMMSASMSVVSASDVRNKDKKTSGTWKRSGMPDNSIRLEVGDNDYIPLEGAQMAVQVDGFRVRVLIDCFFYNDKGDGLEGVFKLNLPNGASPYYFAFGETEYVNEENDDEDSETIKNNKKKVKQLPYTRYNLEDFDLSYDNINDSDLREWSRVKEARIVSKQKAAKAYEQAVSRRIDPALMEWGGADMFSCRVFPLSQNTLHQVVIGYELNMTEALNFREYIMALPKTEKDLRLDVSVFTSPGIQAEITPTPPDAVTKDNHLIFSVTNPKTKEYIIHYNTVAPVLLVQADDNDDEGASYFGANYRIELPEEIQQGLPTDAVFMLDLSLSSNPDKFNVWLKLIGEILTQNRDIIKRFSVLCFNIDNYWYADYFERNNKYNLDRFFEFANTLALEGATNLSSALNEASNPSWLKVNSPKHIFLMSDADCNWGETNMHAFRSMINKGDRIHTYKTGLSGTNTSVLDFLSRYTNGFSFTVTGEEEAALTARSFRYKPWTIEGIKVEGIEDFLISGHPLQLYNGQKLIFTGRGAPTGNINIRVNNGEKSIDLNYSAKEKIYSNLASRIYGQIALGYLENYGYQAEEASVNYSTFYRIPGQYTSFLMLESQWDYDQFGIDDGDAEDFVENNYIFSIIRELEEKGATALLGNGKKDFLTWLAHLQSDKSTINFRPDSAFMSYVNNLPEEIFKIRIVSRNYKVKLTEEQSSEEQQLLSDEDLRFDNMLILAKRRISQYGKAAALKLLSSVVERNAGDLMATRDIAMQTIDWGMGDQAYYLMRRIMDWREGEALAYQAAATALASTPNNIDMAIIYFYLCLNSDWDSDYGSFREITALQCLRYIDSIKDNPKITITKTTKEYLTVLREQLRGILEKEDLMFDEADIVIMVNWNIDNTDIDLHVMEPTGEECYYGNKNTKIGGKLSYDVTSGYGPEMYVLKKSVPGNYKISLNYYSDSDTKTASKAKAYIQIYRDWGRKTEKITNKTVILERQDDRIDVMEFSINK